MSSYDELARAQETQRQQEKGVEAYLSQDERDDLRRKLSFPEEFPPKFGAWIQDYIAVNGSVSRSQVVGLSNLSAHFDTVLTQEGTSTTSYVDLSTVGPKLTGLGDGTYLVLFGCQMTVIANIWGGAMSIATDTDAASDAGGFAIVMTTAEGPEVEAYDLPGMRAVLLTLANGGNNTITAKYRYVNSGSGSPPEYSNRWLVALRVGS